MLWQAMLLSDSNFIDSLRGITEIKSLNRQNDFQR